ncbi:autotransporter outer membrane beta-barrel domain-containing protein [Polynucleobacter paneuropaeus]|nr:autotransporter outer membrane beta-barrel domain-containing protein [Polynucleobacter paneuropaeus]MBT8538758.1 autotransporter outer membrane beta-barrel domain-containing protein [Polynucleobacter paneuropaeus]
MNTTINSGVTVSSVTSPYPVNVSGSNSTLENNGSIYLDSLGGLGLYESGINNSVENGVTGSIQAGYAGINIPKGSSASITNSGLIASTNTIDNGKDNSGLYNGGTINLITNNSGATFRGLYSGIVNTGTISSLNNYGTINATGVYGITTVSAISNSGVIGTINNYQGGVISSNMYSILNYNGSITAINNSGQIKGAYGNDTSAILSYGSSIGAITNTSSGIIGSDDAVNAIYIISNSVVGVINNAGVITSIGYGIAIDRTSQVTSLVNTGSISSEYAIYNSGQIGTLTNGSVTNSTASISYFYQGGSVGTVNNYGVIGDTRYGGIYNDGSINVINNFSGGAILGSAGGTPDQYGIQNTGVITTFNNAQGGNRSSASTTGLLYYGTLPVNYNIIIASKTNYGQLAVTSGAGNTTFGISSLSSGKSAVSTTPYSAVLSGITPTQLGINGTSSSSKSNGYSYTLTETDTLNNIWSLLVYDYYVGPSVANTNQSLVNTASALQGTYTLQNSVIANSFSYDCTVFGANNVCVSAGGRNTQVQAANGLNNTSALLIAAYRPHPNYRIGAYADQNLSVSNPGGTVNLGNNTPLIGLFGAWNERLDGTGTEVKVSAAYGQKNTTITRSVVGSGATASEAGSGSSNLISQGAQVTAKYGFGVLDNVIVSPYVGVRYTQNNMGGYTEGTSSSVTAPLTYSALNTNATTALAGVGASYRVIPAVTTFVSAGVETDTNTANGTYSATNSSIGTLTPVNFNANPVKTRPTATVGAYYDIEKNQRVGITGIYRQEAYQAVQTTTVMATYTIGL